MKTRRRFGTQTGTPHPEVESVPGLLLRVDAVGLGPADGPDVGLVALLEVNELEEERRAVIKVKYNPVFGGSVTVLTSSPICGTKGERRGMVSIIHDGGSHSSASSPDGEEAGFCGFRICCSSDQA